MAQYTVDYHHDSGFSPARILGYIGGILSLVLLAAIVTWGARLVVRDVSEVPVVRAAAGPMRVQPENPGGRIADHEGLAVNEVAAAGAAAPIEERVLLAPEDLDIPAEDLITRQVADVVSVPDLPILDVTSVSARADIPLLAEPAVLSAPADPLQAVLLQVVAQDAPSVAPQASVLRPVARRKRAGVGFRATVIGAPAPAPQILTAAPAGTTVVQLGAFPSEAEATGHWQNTTERFGDLMAQKQLLLQKASSGGAEFYRLRAVGFEDLAQAERFCAAFSAGLDECIPVVIR